MVKKRTKAVLKAISKTIVCLVAFPFVMALAIISGLLSLMRDILEDYEIEITKDKERNS